jgi:hypothetical protein
LAKALHSAVLFNRTIKDYSLNRWLWTPNGTPTWTDGKDGPCVALDPNTDFYTSDVDVAPLVSALGFTMWARAQSDDLAAHHMLQYLGPTGSTGNGFGNQHECHTHTAGQGKTSGSGLGAFLGDGNSSGLNVIEATDVVTTKFHDICVVFSKPSAVSGSLEFYIDGKLVETDTSTDTPSANWTQYRIGAPEDTTPERTWDGRISCCYIWKRKLTVPEVRSLSLDPYEMFRQRKIYYPAVPMIPHALVGFWSPGGMG